MALSDLMSELRHALRTLERTPAFTATAIGMLGLAIGAMAGLYSVIDAVLLKPLPFAEPERLVHIGASAPGSDYPEEFGISREFYVQYREQSRLLADLSTVNAFTNTLRHGDRVERVRMSAPTSTLFSTLGVTPALGRLPVAADEADAVVISDALWASWFGRDPDVLGRTVQVFGRTRSIIGVMGPTFRFPDNGTLLWLSGTLTAADVAEPGQFGGAYLVGRLAPGATPEALVTELTGLARALPERFGGTPAYARLMAQHRAVVRPLEQQFLGRFARPLWVLLGAAFIVLLVACANVANLFLVRAEARHREMAVRSALGAGRRELLRVHLAEAFVIALCAGALAALLAALALPAFLQAAPAQIPRLDQAHVGASTLAFTLVVAMLAALACGLFPALRAAAPDLERLRDGGRGLTARRHGLRQALVAGQTALALLLLIGSGLLLRSVHALRHVDPGYDPRDVFTFQIAPERPELNDPSAFARFHLAFLERLAALPGVQSVGLVENVPINEGTITMHVHTERSRGDGGEGVLLNYTFTAGDYFRTMDIAVLGGRTFTADDHDGARGNVIVSRSAAERLWPGRDPIGQRLQRQGASEWETVVGVVEDVIQDGLSAKPQAVVYFPLVGPDLASSPPISSPAYVVKTARAETIAADIRALVREVAPEAPMYREFTMAGLVRDSMVPVTFLLLTLGIAATLALVLGSVGLYGVLSYTVAERTREIGLRMALGARARQVRAMVVAQGARVVAVGVLIGLSAASASTHALGGVLFGVEPLDAATFAAMAMAMVAVGLLASYLPARRASSLDPIVSLRRE